ncbi:hypothetical protein Tco_0227259 [Tanacetum coccineum]
MATMAENVIAAGSETHGMLPVIRRAQRLEDLARDDKLRYDNDIKVVNILLLDFPVDIYTLINRAVSKLQRKYVDRVKALMEGIELNSSKNKFEKAKRFPAPVVLCWQMPTITSFLISVIKNRSTAKKRVKDSEWFKEKMLLAQAQEAGVVLDEEQQDFLADSLEETDDCEDLQLQATANFKADHVDAYDSDYDDEAIANPIFMANFSPVGSLNDDTVSPCYDYDTLFEVPHYDTYHDSDVLNSNIQELGYIKNIVSNNDSYDELKGDVISYTDYMLTIANDEDNYVPPPVQKNDMILSVVEQMKSQVEKCNRVLDYAVKIGHSEKEAYIFENNKLRAQFKGKFSEYQMNHNGTSVNTKLSKPSTSGTKLYSVTLFPKSKVISKVVEKNDLSISSLHT